MNIAEFLEKKAAEVRQAKNLSEEIAILAPIIDVITDYVIEKTEE